MLYPKIEDCVEAVSCKYTLAVIVAKRAKELTMKMPAEFVDSKTKEITYALNEILNGKLARFTNS
jgi:DNA-directed RNA polymerase subunit omega